MSEAREIAPVEAERGRSRPLVSVIIPAYNCASLIGETLASVYSQTYGHWEAIIVDDGSTDDTRGALAAHMGRIRYFPQDNRGTAAARNAGVRQARGDLLAFLDNDDIWLPEKLELQVRVMQESPQCGLVFSDAKPFTADGVLRESMFSGRLDRWIDANITRDPLIAEGRLFPQLLFSNEIASASSVMVRRECFERSGGFDETISIADDYDLWMRIARLYEIAVIRRCLYMWRVRDDSQSGPARERRHRWMEAGLKALEKQLLLVSPELRAPLRAHMAGQYWECARHYFDLDQFVDSRSMLWGCLRHKRSFGAAMVFLLASYLGKPLVDGMRRVKHRLRSVRRNRT